MGAGFKDAKVLIKSFLWVYSSMEMLSALSDLS
jgi:hypothetical protein